MKFVPTFVHGIGDYLGAALLMLAPNIFGFADVGGPAVLVPRVIGVMILLQAVTTDYELGIVRMLPMKMHLMVDYVASLFLAASPWIFGFSDAPQNVWMPHVVAGIGVFLFSLVTEEVPRTSSIGHTPTGRGTPLTGRV